jgi:hypothetical protein
MRFRSLKEMERKSAWREGGILLGKTPSHRCDGQNVPRGIEEEDGLERRRQIPDTLQPRELDKPPLLIEGG